MSRPTTKKPRKSMGTAQTPRTRKRAPKHTEVANAAVNFAFDAYDTSRPKLMRRRTAGEGFISGFARHAVADQFLCFARNHKDFTAFNDLVAKHGSNRPSIWYLYHEPNKLAEAGCLHTPDPNVTRYA